MRRLTSKVTRWLSPLLGVAVLATGALTVATPHSASALPLAECRLINVTRSLRPDKKGKPSEGMVSRSALVSPAMEGPWVILLSSGKTKPLNKEVHTGNSIAMPLIGSSCVVNSKDNFTNKQFTLDGQPMPSTLVTAPPTTLANIPMYPAFPITAPTDPNPAKTCAELYADGSVLWEQCMLTSTGFHPGPIDGFHGSMTKEAERRFWYCQSGNSSTKGTPHSQIMSNLRGSYASGFAKGCDSNIDSPKSQPLDDGSGTAGHIADDLVVGMLGTAACGFATAVGLGIGAVTTGGATGGPVVMAGTACELAIIGYIAEGWSK
jgi:hypothetical protein